MTDQQNVIPLNAGSVKGKRKKKAKRRMIAPVESICVRQIPLGDLMRSKKFNSFDGMRQEANRIVGKMRASWMDFVLMKAGVYVNFAEITRREVIEIYERSRISITSVDNVDRIYQADILIGEWDRERTVFLNEEGKLMMEIKYFAL